MDRFITHVELHGATGNHYARLHRAMESRGFCRFITDDRGDRHYLPTAVYACTGDFAADHVRDLAQSAAEYTGCRAWIFTCVYVEASWYLYCRADPSMACSQRDL